MIAPADGAKQGKRSPWPTIWVAVGIAEVERAGEFGGENGVAIYTALNILRFRAPKEAKACFYASGAQIARLAGLSERSIRRPLKALEDAGLVVITRPRGAARLAHEACRYSLKPFFVVPNKVRSGVAKSSFPEAARIPFGGSNEVGTETAVSSIAPLQGDIGPPAALAGVVAPAGRSGEQTQKENQDDQWY